MEVAEVVDLRLVRNVIGRVVSQEDELGALERVRQVRKELEAWKDSQEVKDLERQLETTSIRIAT